MSILIKGMKMPKDGALVEVLIWSDGHVTKTGDSYRAEDGRHYYKPCDWEYFSAVPVPPHGRVIDADKIPYTKIMYDASEDKFYYGVTKPYIDRMPTIIESEE